MGKKNNFVEVIQRILRNGKEKLSTKQRHVVSWLIHVIGTLSITEAKSGKKNKGHAKLMSAGIFNVCHDILRKNSQKYS